MAGPDTPIEPSSRFSRRIARLFNGFFNIGNRLEFSSCELDSSTASSICLDVSLAPGYLVEIRDACAGCFDCGLIEAPIGTVAADKILYREEGWALP